MGSLLPAVLALAVLAMASYATPVAAGSLDVQLTVTGGPGNYAYDVSVINGLTLDVVLVNLIDAPPGDSLVAASASAPSGFLAHYETALGIVDLAEASQLFGAGTTVSGFTFNSASAPATGVFEHFEAYTTDGGLLSGTITVVPEPAFAVAAMAGLMLLGLLARRGHRPLLSIVIPSMIVGLVLVSAPGVRAADHGDAPLMLLDPVADNADLFAFVGRRYDNPAQPMLNVIATVSPLAPLASGGLYARFASDARYSIHITNQATGAEVIRYDFVFSDQNATMSPGLKNAATIFSYGDPLGSPGSIDNLDDAAHNFVQRYTVTRVTTAGGAGASFPAMTPPPNVGINATPHYNDGVTGFAISGATTLAELDVYTRQAITPLSNGHVVFAGQREDPFYADMAGVFDLVDARIADNDGNPGNGFGQDGAGVDSYKAANVMAIALQIPLDSLSSVPGFPIVGVYASVSRPRIRILRTSDEPVETGAWIQISRTANPLFNKWFVPLGLKDQFNREDPTTDGAYASFATTPELAGVLDARLGTSIAGTGRSDLVGLYVPDVLRVDTGSEIPPLPGQAGFSRLGRFGGDVILGSLDILPSGWPNGRRPGDDVVDILLTYLASGPDYFSITLFGDNVAANDQIYHQVFPYLATPHSGLDH